MASISSQLGELLSDPHHAFHLARRGLGFLRAQVTFRGCELGDRVAVMGPIEVENHGRIRIDHHSYFLPGMLKTHLKVRPGAELLIGSHVGFNFGVTLEADKRIVIGDRCMFASLVTLRDATLGENVWVAHGATVEAGVTIGEGSVISAGTTVTRDVPPHHLAIGSPARNVRLDTLSRTR